MIFFAANMKYKLTKNKHQIVYLTLNQKPISKSSILIGKNINYYIAKFNLCSFIFRLYKNQSKINKYF